MVCANCVVVPIDEDLKEEEIERIDEDLRGKGPNVTPGYYEEPELTRPVFRQGYFMNGDRGYSISFFTVRSSEEHPVVPIT